MATPVNDVESLITFIAERLQIASPTLDVSEGSAVATQVFAPLRTRLGPDPYDTPILEFIISRLSTEFPGLSLEDGSPIEDYLLDPARILLEPFRRQIGLISNNQSLANASTMNSSEADKLAANYFERRKLGGYAVGVARLYFSAPQFAQVTPSNYVSGPSGLKFYPVESQAISPDSMLFNTEGAQYYFDVVVRSEAPGEDYNIDPGYLTSVVGLSQVVRVTNKTAFEEGKSSETTEEYLTRVQAGLTEKSLVTTRGITARLRDVFDAVRSLTVIGYGDPEMERDVVTGSSESRTYATFMGNTSSGSGMIPANLTVVSLQEELINDGTPGHNNFLEALVKVGDILSYADFSNQVLVEYVVTDVWSATHLLVTPNIPVGVTSGLFLLRRANGTLTLSGIPGGILAPNTPNGTIALPDGQVHIGGMLDVFVRAGDPTSKNTVMTGVLDDRPLHFGVDLESFGEDDTYFVSLTGLLLNGVRVPSTDRYGAALATLDQLLVKMYSIAAENSGVDIPAPWRPVDSDIGRYVQLYLDMGMTVAVGTFRIAEILGNELDGSTPATRVRLETNPTPVDWITPDVPVGAKVLTTSPTYLGYRFRLLEGVNSHNLVRDLGASRVALTMPSTREVLTGPDMAVLGARIGDSLVVESGDDSGIYSIRRILGSLDSNDCLLLSRDLSRTLHPTGTGDRSGLRYRISNDLNVDLISPKVTKIPLGDVFMGQDLVVVAGSTQVRVVGDTDFVLAGVTAGDVLNIATGSNQGSRIIKSVTPRSAVLDSPLVSTQFLTPFSVYRALSGISRPMVRLQSVELLDASQQPTGVKVPYGDVVDARVSGQLSNRAEGLIGESYSGETQFDVLGGILVDHSEELDFIDLGVGPGFRVSILSSVNIGEYSVKEVLAGDTLRVVPYSEGGTDFRAEQGETTDRLHFKVGLPSSGVARLYFAEPTSVEVSTGLAGGRLSASVNGASRSYRFSEVEGRRLLPAPGSPDTEFRDLRVVRCTETSAGSGHYQTTLEFTDIANPDVFENELQEGDVLDVNEQIPFLDSSGNSLRTQGIFGKPAGLRTISGSNRVSLPPNSVIDFQRMDTDAPLTGQLLYLDAGTDAGIYTIEEVLDSKTLRLDRPLHHTTETILGFETTARDGVLSAGTTGVNLQDTTDAVSLGSQIGYYITIFESKRLDSSGSFEILSRPTSSSAELDMDIPTPAYLNGSGSFSWLRTPTSAIAMCDFRIYQVVPTKVEITQVSTRESQIALGSPSSLNVRLASLSASDGLVVVLDDAGAEFISNGVLEGARIEVLAGPAAGVYRVDVVSTARVLVIHTSKPFPVSGVEIAPYKIWGGIHGSTRMVTTGPHKDSSGRIEFGELLPYVIRRPGVARLSSTEMSAQFDGALYYMDVQIESEGCGDELSLADQTLLSVDSGVLVDGYTYEVANSILTFSPFEQVSLSLRQRLLPVGNSDTPSNLIEVSGRNLGLTYEYSTTTRLVHDLLTAETERPINANPLARHVLPSYVMFSMRYRGGAADSVMVTDLVDYINALGLSEELDISELEAMIKRRGATYVKHPITLVSLTHDLDRKLVITRSQDMLKGVSATYHGSSRITGYFAIAGNLDVHRE